MLNMIEIRKVIVMIKMARKPLPDKCWYRHRTDTDVTMEQIMISPGSDDDIIMNQKVTSLWHNYDVTIEANGEVIMDYGPLVMEITTPE